MYKLSGLKAVAIIFHVLFLVFINIAYGNEIPKGTVGVVTKNTFLLSRDANVKRENKYVYGLVGYLPIGTRIYIEGKKRTVNNLSLGTPEIYYPISSSIGIGGLIREDRIRLVTTNPIGVVVSSNEIALHHPDPKRGKWKKLLTMGKYGGDYLEILGNVEDEFYSAMLHRSVQVEGLPKSEPVRVWGELVKSGSIFIVNPANSYDAPVPVPVWSDKKKIDLGMIDNLVEAIKEKLGDNIDDLKPFLTEFDGIQCLLSSDAKASLGFKLFGTGLSFDLKASFKEQDHMYRFTRRQLTSGDKHETYTFLQNVSCEGSTPKRLQQLTIQEGVYNPDRRIRIELQDFKLSTEPWKTTLSGKDKPFRMIQIRGEADYFNALKFLDRQVAIHDDSFISSVSPEKKEILLNAILREISFFEHRENILDQNARNLSRLNWIISDRE